MQIRNVGMLFKKLPRMSSMRGNNLGRHATQIYGTKFSWSGARYFQLQGCIVTLTGFLFSDQKQIETIYRYRF